MEGRTTFSALSFDAGSEGWDEGWMDSGCKGWGVEVGKWILSGGIMSDSKLSIVLYDF